MICEAENSGPLWRASFARSCCCGVGVSSYTAQGKHHRMSFSSFLKDRMTPHVCVTVFLVILLTNRRVNMFQMCRNSVSCFVAVMRQTGLWNMEPWPKPKVMVHTQFQKSHLNQSVLQ